MKIIGSPSEWLSLIDTLVPEILDLVVSTWDKMPPPAPNAFEDPTTEELCRCLRQNRNSSNLPFTIHIQFVELEPAAEQDQGRLDIAFFPAGVPRENIYFCLECKRLDVVKDGKFRSYAPEYVIHGMMRFVRGQYSAGVQNGGMLGYVLDGNTDQAIDSVGNAVQVRHTDLGMTGRGDMQPSAVRPENTRLRETYHTRPHDGLPFRIHHIFVPGVIAAGYDKIG